MSHQDSSEALRFLNDLGAPPRLVRHSALVAEAATLLVDALKRCGAPVDDRLVIIGAALHDAGKILHPEELDGPGLAHEQAGEALLLQSGIPPPLARGCVSYACWRVMNDVSLEDLLIALADTLWKGQRNEELESRVIDRVRTATDAERWALFLTLDSEFETIASGGLERLARS